MSQLTINRIRGVIEQQFGDLIDMSDCDRSPHDQRQRKFLSRGLAALSIRSLSGVDPAHAAGSIVDGFQDGGIDAIYFDQKADTLLLVQAKWNDTGNRPPDPEGVAKFTAGVTNLLNAKFERFNEKVRNKEGEILAAIHSSRPVRIRLILAHTSAQKTPSHATRILDDLVNDLNNPVPTAVREEYDQAGVYGLITAESKPPSIDLQITLADWGAIRRPFEAYYGRAHASEVSQWWKDHENKLFEQNLRLFYQSSDVNNAIHATLTDNPQHFWYFNNGVTLICEKITKSIVGSPGTKLGLFHCVGVGIVNGAQTVGTIGRSDYLGGYDEHQDPDAHPWVQVRLISLENSPPDISRRITRAANLQNQVGNREFAGMDPRQHRLATEFALDRRKYVYKQGEPDPKGDEGCDISEATQALACARSAALAVQVKREIGAIWADTESAPYTEIFTDELSSGRLWRSVKVMRTVDEELYKLRSSVSPRSDMVAVHMNRIVLHLVFQEQDIIRNISNENTDEGDLLDKTRLAVEPVFRKLSYYLEKHHSNEYLASLSKNSTKCENLVKQLLMPTSTVADTEAVLRQGNLFGEENGEST